MTPHAYHLQEFADAGTEHHRLQRQLHATAELEARALQEAGLPQCELILELGCGPSAFTPTLAALAPDSRVLCLDYDLQALRSGAGQRHGLLPVPWTVCANAAALPLAPGRASAAYFRFVLQHVLDPVAVLCGAAALLTPGGLVCALDGDIPAMTLHPEPNAHREVLASAQALHQARGGDRAVGRKLVAHLCAAGLHDVTCRSAATTTGELGVTLFKTLFLDTLVAQLQDLHLATAARTDYLAWAQHPGAFGLMVGVLAWGRT